MMIDNNYTALPRCQHRPKHFTHDVMYDTYNVMYDMCDAHALFIPIPQMGKWRPTEVKWCAQGRTAR